MEPQLAVQTPPGLIFKSSVMYFISPTLFLIKAAVQKFICMPLSLSDPARMRGEGNTVQHTHSHTQTRNNEATVERMNCCCVKWFFGFTCDLIGPGVIHMLQLIHRVDGGR